MTRGSHQETHEDRFAECVRLRLKARKVKKRKLRLDVDINFADEWCDLETRRWLVLRDSWRFRFSIRSGELRLLLDQLTSPLEGRDLRLKLPLKEPRKRVSGHAATHIQEHEATSKVSGSAGILDASVSGEVGDRNLVRNEAGETRSDEHVSPQVLVHEKGDEANPSWSFRSNVEEEVLYGGVESSLAELEIGGKPYGVEASFRTSFQSVKVMEVDSAEFERLPALKRLAVVAAMREYVYAESREYMSRAAIRSRA